MLPIIGFLPNLGGPELLVIFVLVLILFGAKKIPEFAKGLGKGMGEFKKARQEFENELTKAEEATRPDPTPAPKKAEPKESSESN